MGSDSDIVHAFIHAALLHILTQLILETSWTCVQWEVPPAEPAEWSCWQHVHRSCAFGSQTCWKFSLPSPLLLPVRNETRESFVNSCPFRMSSPEAAEMYMQPMVTSHSTYCLSSSASHTPYLWAMSYIDHYMLKFAWGGKLMAVCENAQERVWNKPVSNTVRQRLNEPRCVMDIHNDSFHNRSIKRPIF